MLYLIVERHIYSFPHPVARRRVGHVAANNKPATYLCFLKIDRADF